MPRLADDSVDGGKADLALGHVGAFLFAPRISFHMPSFIADGAAMVIERGWLVLHESGTDVKFTQAGACSLNSCLLADRPNSCTSPQLGRFLSFDQSISRLVESDFMRGKSAGAGA